MKKLFTFLGLLITLAGTLNVNAQYYQSPLVDETFDGWTAVPAGWSIYNTSGSSITVADSLRYAGSGSGSRGSDLIIPANRDSSIIYVSFDLFFNSATVARNNAFGLFLSGSNSTNLATDGYHSELITSVYLGGTDKKFHVWNKDIKGPVPVDKPDTIVPVFYKGNTFARPGTTNAICDSINLSTQTSVVYTSKKTYHFLFVMNFDTKKVDVTITQKDDPANTETITGLDFIAPAANDLARIGMDNTRSNTSYLGVTGPSSVGNGGNSALDVSLDNLYIYQMVKSLGKADVTINYKDLDGNVVKTARVEPDQEIGLAYKLPSSDVSSFTDAGNYYAYDAVATGSESVEVVAGGSSINVIFKKTAVTAGAYVWKGMYSEYWNELDANFSTDGTNELGYQKGNSITFSDAMAPIKEVTQSKNFDLGAGDLIIDAPGYTIKNGAGEILSGTGAIKVNATASLGLSTKNLMPVYVNKDTLTVTNAELASKLIVADGTFLQPGYSITTPIEGTGETLTILSKVFNYTSSITGVKNLNYVLQTKGSAGTSGIKGMSKMYFSFDSLAKVNVSTTAGNASIFATYPNYRNNYISLGDSVYMAYSETPSPNGTTVQNIGELKGSKSAKLVGPSIRKMTYNIGYLNTDASFDGELKPILTDSYGNFTDFNINKVGKGKWTLNGSSPYFLGKVTVTDGVLEVNDTLCNGIGTYTYPTTTVNNQIAEVLVTDTATLKGSGFIGSLQTTLNGTITGKLTLGGNLSLKIDMGEGGATTIINVNGTDVDKITVEGDLYYGGKLKVNIISAPPAGDYQILKFNSYIESGMYGFDTIDLPVGYTYDYTTGMLHVPTGVKYIDANKEVSSIEYFDLTGKKVMKNTAGLVIMKVKYTDGTSGVYKTFKKDDVRK